MKYSDSIHKLFATSISIIIASFLYSGILFPHYMPLNNTFYSGSMVILLSALAYFVLAGKKQGTLNQSYAFSTSTSSSSSTSYSSQKQDVNISHSNSNGRGGRGRTGSYDFYHVKSKIEDPPSPLNSSHPYTDTLNPSAPSTISTSTMYRGNISNNSGTTITATTTGGGGFHKNNKNNTLLTPLKRSNYGYGKTET